MDIKSFSQNIECLLQDGVTKVKYKEKKHLKQYSVLEKISSACLYLPRQLWYGREIVVHDEDWTSKNKFSRKLFKHDEQHGNRIKKIGIGEIEEQRYPNFVKESAPVWKAVVWGASVCGYIVSVPLFVIGAIAKTITLATDEKAKTYHDLVGLSLKIINENNPLELEGDIKKFNIFKEKIGSIDSKTYFRNWGFKDFSCFRHDSNKDEK